MDAMEALHDWISEPIRVSALWWVMLPRIVEHRAARRLEQDHPNTRFTCQIVDGVYYCNPIYVDPNHPLGVLDFVPVNFEAVLSALLAKASEPDGTAGREYLTMLEAYLSGRGVEEEQLGFLRSGERGTPLEYLRAAIDLVLDREYLRAAIDLVLDRRMPLNTPAESSDKDRNDKETNHV